MQAPHGGDRPAGHASSRPVVRDLVRSLDWPGDAPSAGTPPHRAQELRERLGDGPTRWVLGVARRSVAALRAEELTSPLARWEELDRFTLEMVADTVLSLVGEGSGFDGARLVHGGPQGGLVEDIVAHDVTLGQINAALRARQRDWLSLLVDAAVEGAGAADAVPDIALSVTSTMDRWIDTIRESVLEERRRVSQSEQARDRATIEALLRGARVDDAVVLRLLGVPGDAWHLGCVVGVRPGRQVELRTVEGVARDLASAAGTSRSVRYDTSDGQVFLWTSSVRPVAPLVLDRLRVPDTVVVGFGEPRRGVEGFRRTHVEARDALGVASRAAVDRAAYRDVALAALLTRDDERAGWFVDHELGELANDSPDMAALRSSLQAFYRMKMRIAPAAEHLFVHRNTLISRLERAEAHLGRKVTDRTAQTQAALLLHDLLRGHGSR